MRFISAQGGIVQKCQFRYDEIIKSVTWLHHVAVFLWFSLVLIIRAHNALIMYLLLNG